MDVWKKFPKNNFLYPWKPFYDDVWDKYGYLYLDEGWTLPPLKAILKVPQGEINRMNDFTLCGKIIDVSLWGENNCVLEGSGKVYTQMMLSSWEQLHKHLKGIL